MASIFRVVTTRAVPAGAEIVTKGGKRHIRLSRDGRSVLRALTDCGTKYRDPSKCWYIKYKDHTGRWLRVRGYSDRTATAQFAAKLERNREQIHSGLVDPHEAAMTRPLMEHVEDFRIFLKSKANSNHHVEQTYRRIKRIVQSCKFRCWKEIVPSALTHWLSQERVAERMGIKTSNYYQAAMKEFCTWMVSERRVTSNPIAHLRALNAEADIRRQRRPLTPEVLQSSSSRQPRDHPSSA